MITLYAAMLVTLGFLIAALIVVVLLPAYRHRIERFTTEALKRTLPLTEAEIRADKDRLRADFAMQFHRLETKVEEAALSSARQSVEINRRDAKIHELNEAIADQKMSVEEHENARRVLEQAILDRLPKVEQRLAETRKLLATRDREIKTLSATSTKQAAALEEATQLNVQRGKELAKLRVTLETRAIRNRDSADGSRFDGGVALRTELESLRAQARDQADLIEKLQASAGSARAVPSADDETHAGEIKRLTSALAKAESEFAAFKASLGDEDEARLALEDRIADLEAANDSKATELAKVRASLRSYESDAGAAPGIAQRADLSALQAEVDDQRRTIAALRAEIAASQERLSRQALHFHEEIRRVASPPSDDDKAEAEGASRKSLAERISAPRGSRAALKTADGAGSDDADAPREQRPAGYLRALSSNGNGNGGNGSVGNGTGETPPPLPAAEAESTPNGAQPAAPPRRPRLLERISGLDKG